MIISNSTNLRYNPDLRTTNKRICTFGETTPPSNSNDEFKNEESLAAKIVQKLSGQENKRESILFKITKVFMYMFAADKMVKPEDAEKALSETNKTSSIEGTKNIEKSQNTASDLDDVPKEYIDLFEHLKDYKGKEFLKEAFLGMRKIMNLDNLARYEFVLVPKTLTLIASADSTGKVNLYHVLLNHFPSKKDEFELQWIALGAIAHELEHVRLFSEMIRLGDIGVEKYKEVHIDRLMRNHNISREEAKKIIDPLLENFINESKKLPQYEINSPEGEKAMQWLTAIEKYPEKLETEEENRLYETNPIEKQADAFEKQIFDYLRKWQNSKKSNQS